MANRFFDIRGSVEFGCSFTDVNENDWFFADVLPPKKPDISAVILTVHSSECIDYKGRSRCNFVQVDKL